MRRRRVGELVLALLLPIVSVSSASAAPEPDPGVRRALLIGINRYLADEYPDLRGAVNDTETMRQVLTTRFGFADEHVTVLEDEDATRKGILSALERLAGVTEPNDVVYIHYSGHGSQVVDLNDDEADDGMDETLVPHDGRTADVPDITDDELGEILGRVRARAGMVVLDSCHSGTALRGAQLTRSIPPDERIELYRRPETATRAIVALDRPEHLVLFSGAASDESALDGPIDGRYHGLFSYALSRAMSSAAATASPKELHAAIQQEWSRVSERFGGVLLPEPQVEASEDRLTRPLFPELRGGSARSFLEVGKVKDDRVVLVDGNSLGAAPGSYWAIYEPGESAFRPGKALALGRVVEVRGDDAIATLDRKTPHVKQGCRAVEALPATPTSRIPVHWTSSGERRLGDELEAALRKHTDATQSVGPDAFARFVVQVGPGRTCRVLGAGGSNQVDAFDVESLKSAAARLAELFQRSLNAVALLDLTNPSSQIELDVGVVGVEAPGPHAFGIRRSGQPRTHTNSLMLEIRSDRDAYLTVIDVDSAGNINLLFPTDASNEGFLPEGLLVAGRTVRIPDALHAENRAGFYWDYSPPAGIDTVLVFASADPAIAAELRQFARGFAGSATGTATRSAGPPLPVRLEALRNTLALRNASRGIMVVQDEAEDGPTEVEGPGAVPTEDAAPPPEETADWTSVALRILVSS